MWARRLPQAVKIGSSSQMHIDLRSGMYSYHGTECDQSISSMPRYCRNTHDANMGKLAKVRQVPGNQLVHSYLFQTDIRHVRTASLVLRSDLHEGQHAAL